MEILISFLRWWKLFESLFAYFEKELLFRLKSQSLASEKFDFARYAPAGPGREKKKRGDEGLAYKVIFFLSNRNSNYLQENVNVLFSLPIQTMKTRSLFEFLLKTFYDISRETFRTIRIVFFSAKNKISRIFFNFKLWNL